VAVISLEFVGAAGRLTLGGNGFVNENAQILSELEVVALPTSYVLEQNYPNPFNPGTTVKFKIPAKGPVQLTIYNLRGQKIRTLVDAILDPGEFNAAWDGRNDAGDLVSSGTYIYHMRAGSFVSSQKMMLVR
jgi:hypothetical protein